MILPQTRGLRDSLSMNPDSSFRHGFDTVLGLARWGSQCSALGECWAGLFWRGLTARLLEEEELSFSDQTGIVAAVEGLWG
jgi:hypothetical protein